MKYSAQIIIYQYLNKNMTRTVDNNTQIADFTRKSSVSLDGYIDYLLGHRKCFEEF